MRRIAIIFLLGLMVSAGAWAQAGAGSAAVTGRVMELAGDGIPDTTVTVSNAGLGFRRVMTTSDDGVFDAPSLVPSAGYQIKITRKGFMDWQSGQVTLALGQTMNFTVTLKHTAGYQGDESKIPQPRIEETQNGQGTLLGQRSWWIPCPRANLRAGSSGAGRSAGRGGPPHRRHHDRGPGE